MAVRVFNYTVSEDSILSSSMAQGGVQGEHNATQVNFQTSNSLVSKLNSMKGEGKTFCYRFDRYDGAGGKNSTDPVAFVPGEKTVFSHPIEQWQTKYGGTIQVYFVITLNSGDETEFELYSYCVKLMLKSLPNAEEVDGENYESISTLAMSVKANTKIVEEATKIAVEACEKTELARAALEGGTEWIFDGGDASGEINVGFVVDTTLSEVSKNAIQNGVITKEINTINEHLIDIDVDLSKKELTNNKVNVINKNNTDLQYPSAMAVYKYGLRPVMTVCLQEEAVYGEEKIPLNQIRAQSECNEKYLISENGTIKIGEGVNKVLVSGQIFAQMESSVQYLWGAIHLCKSNGTETQISVALDSTTLDYASVSFSPIVVDVESGDCFFIKKYSNTKDTVRSVSNTYMTVQVVDMNQEVI